jgi:hypothetical protein
MNILFIVILLLSGLGITVNGVGMAPFLTYYDNYEYNYYYEPVVGEEVSEVETTYQNDCWTYYEYTFFDTPTVYEYFICRYWPATGNPYEEHYGTILGQSFYEITTNSYDKPIVVNRYWREDRYWTGNGITQWHVLEIDCKYGARAVNIGQGSKPDQLMPLRARAEYYSWDQNLGGWPLAGQITFDELRVAGITPDCNGCLYKVIDYSQTPIDITPVASGYNNYEFTIEYNNARKENITKSHHQLLPSPISCSSLQSIYNDTSISVFATDTDLCMLNSQAEMYPVENRADDVPYYVEYIVSPASSEVFPSQYNGTNYNDIVYLPDLSVLVNDSFCNVKIVRTLPTGIIGYSSGNSSVIKASAITSTPNVLLHEWLHTMGVSHRGTPGNPSESGITDDEYCGDTYALMYYQNYNGSEINRSERR